MRVFFGVIIFLALCVVLVLAAQFYYNAIGLSLESPVRFLTGMVIGWASSMLAWQWVKRS